MISVGDFGAAWLDRRERSGVRDAKGDRGRWRLHVEPAAFVREPLDGVTRAMARGWLVELASVKAKRSGQLLAPQTLKNVLNLVRVAFEEAREDALIETNVFRDLRFPRGRMARTSDPWTVLYPEEQEALLRVVPLDECQIVRFAMGIGLRAGELWSLSLEDLDLGSNPNVTLRWGGIWKGEKQPTKSGKPRRVPLFGRALDALRTWLPMLPTYAPKNPLSLVFPQRCGSHRWLDPPSGWRSWLELAGIRRRVRWHDLRHTCASSLVAGWWGRAWSLEEVSRLLGHASILTTQRYAHFSEDFLTRAADESDAARRNR